jgi:acetolactate synthase II small subunit
MTTTSLTVTLNRREGALLRLLGTVERRGFEVVAVHADSAASVVNVSLTVRGPRDAGVLIRQLARLVDVAQISQPTA